MQKLTDGIVGGTGKVISGTVETEVKLLRVLAHF